MEEKQARDQVLRTLISNDQAGEDELAETETHSQQDGGRTVRPSSTRLSCPVSAMSTSSPLPVRFALLFLHASIHAIPFSLNILHPLPPFHHSLLFLMNSYTPFRVQLKRQHQPFLNLALARPTQARVIVLCVCTARPVRHLSYPSAS